MSSTELDFCRICFRENGNISVPDYECEDAWSLSDRIFECVSVQISPNDKLPRCICQLCLDQVIKWCEFKTVCDRNQRTWFLWLKGLSYSTPQELCEGLAEKAKQKSLEIDQSRKSVSPQKSVSQSLNEVHAVSHINRNEKDDDSIVIIDDEGDDRSDSPKEIRIESTTSLVHHYGSADADKLVSPCQKPANGFVILDSGFTTLDQRKDLDVMSTETILTCPVDSDGNVDNELDRADVPSDLSKVIDTPTESSNIPCITDASKDPIENRLDSDDLEVENAFSSVEINDDELPDREVALLNGIEVTDQIEGAPSNLTDSNSKNNDSVSQSFSVPDAPKTPDGFVNILKNRLLESKNNDGQQPKRPDTPYPHEILRTMTKSSDSSSPIKPTPLLPGSSLSKPSEERVNFTPPPPVALPQKSGLKPPNLGKVNPCSVENVSNSDSGISTTPEVGSIRPHNISHLTNEPQTPSERMSESSDSNSFYQMDLAFRVKQEPLSEPEDYAEEDISYGNISIKMEPMDYIHRRYNQEEPAAVIDEPLEPNQTFCKVCRKRFSSNDSLLRHIQGSAIHKHISSFLAMGHKVDSKMISQLSKEVRSRAFFRACAQKRMRAIENGEPLDNPMSVESPAPRQNNKELLECKICNITLSSRAYKLKHDNSWSHKRQVDAFARMEEEKRLQEMANSLPQPSLVGSSLNAQLSPSPSTSYQAMTYTCPFASCSALFSDGGQLIVHMHTHGISLPIHEVNKQIELNKKAPEKKKVPLKQSKLDQPVQSMKFTCRRCNRGFSKGISLSNHLRRCRAPISKPTVTHTEMCSICQIPQRNKKCLTYHMKMYHPNVLTVEAPVPEDDYEQEPNIGVKNNQCKICRKLFSSYIHMRRHLLSVHNKKPMSCRLCKQICKSKDHLISHYRKIHLKLKVGDHACYICFKICKSRAELYQHKKYNCSLKMKLFSCSSCSHSFKSEASLEKHKEEEHTVVTPKTEVLEPLDFSFLDDRTRTACGLCDKSYVHYYNLLRHVKNRHMNGQEDQFAKDANSSVSIASSTPTISINDDSSSSKASSIRNTQPQGKDLDRLFDCLYCDSKFTMRCNMLTHMKMTCRMTPPTSVCRGCKAERWPWVTGPCKDCGKDFFPRKRSASLSLEPNAKKPKLGDTSVVSTPATVATSQPQIYKVGSTSGKEPPVPNKLYKCSVGKRTFVSQKAMLSHSMSCVGTCKDQAIRCKSCNLVYPNPKAYLRHKPCAGRPIECKQTTSGFIENSLTKEPVILYPCEFCAMRFKNRKSCCTHMRKVHKHYSKRGKPSHGIPRLAIKTEELLNSEEPSNFVETPTQGTSSVIAGNMSSEAFLENMPTTETMCPACARTFPNHTVLLQHIKNFHRNKISMSECTFCSQNILRRALYEHGFVCIKDQLVSISTLECVVCSTVFYNTDDDDTISLKLQEHIMNCCKLTMGRGEKFKNKDKFLCLKCCMLFSSKKSLYSHSYERHNILIQTSPPQPKASKVESLTKLEESVLSETLDDSVVTDEVETPLESDVTPVVNPLIKCPRCSKRFLTKKGFKSHMRTHMFAPRRRKKVLKCQYCQRQFYNELKLRNHEKVHGIVKELVLEGDPEKLLSEPSSPLPTLKELDKDASITEQDVVQIIGPIPES